MRINATSFKNHLGRYIESAIKEPVIVEKAGRASAVLISFDEFEKLSQYEDFYWSIKADFAEKEGFLGVDKTTKQLQKYANRAGISMDGENETIRHNEAG